LIFAPPAYAPASQTDLEARSAIAEAKWQTKTARWIDENPIAYVVIVTGLVYATKATLSSLAEQSSEHYNDKEQPYPKVIDPKTKKPVEFPQDPKWTPKDQREPRPSGYRDDFMREWENQGYPEPDGGWNEYEIHHKKPLEYGGDNSFDNGTPLKSNDHLKFTKWWRGGYNKPK
jgi:5-methylcytosine-specific restriction endonuclease McrA